MKKINIKSNKGITLVTLMLAIVIMMIISSTLIYNSRSGINTRALNDMYNDIKMLKDKIEIYYAQYGTIPIIKTKYTNVANIKGINVNDSDEYYVIDLEAIDNLTLNYGKDYKNYKVEQTSTKTDMYIINEKSHTIYYVKGIEVDKKTYYTVPEEYTKIEVPEVNKITLQKLDKGVATIGIDASNKDVGIKTIKLYKGDTVYKTYEYTDMTKERKKETIDVEFVAPEESKWHIEAVDTNENVTSSNEITINSDYYLKVAKPEGVTWDETQVDCYQDEEGAVIPVPKGFTPILKKDGQGMSSTGFVIKDTSSNSETRGNEFVWIPCEIETEENKTNGKLKYNRYTFGSYGNSGYTEAMDEQTSVETYGGYYIGRYEAGIAGGTLTATSYTNDSSLTTEENQRAKENWTGYTGGKLVVKKGQQVWNYITRDRAKTEAEKLYNKEENNVKSKLISSYGWDTALKFMQNQTEDAVKNYPTNSVGGYYEQGLSGRPTTTGYDTTHPCNIYDMGGNVWEWTTESFSEGSYPCTGRGGGYVLSAGSCPAANRDDYSTTDAKRYHGFRVTLYM